MNMTLCTTPFIPAKEYASQVGQSRDKIVGMILLNYLPGKKLCDGEWYVNVLALTMAAIDHAGDWLEKSNSETNNQHFDD